MSPRERAKALGWKRGGDEGGAHWYVWLPHAAVGGLSVGAMGGDYPGPTLGVAVARALLAVWDALVAASPAPESGLHGVEQVSK